MQAAADGGSIARNARLELEAQTGKQVVTPLNAKSPAECFLPAGTSEREPRCRCDPSSLTCSRSMAYNPLNGTLILHVN